jgi:hypothetical protein
MRVSILKCTCMSRVIILNAEGLAAFFCAFDLPVVHGVITWRSPRLSYLS